MATLTIRQLDDGVYQRLKARARANNRSIEAEVRTILGERTRGKSEIVRDLRAYHAEMVAKHGGFLSDSAEIIREMRDEE